MIPQDLLEEGREVEEKFADVCSRLADCYQRLLDVIKEKVGIK